MSLSTVVGRVAALHRYPVKSMAGEALEHADVAWHGLAEDRRWGFLREGQARSGFPWLTLRQRPELVLYRPRPTGRSVVVRTPSGAEFDVTDPALAAELGGRPMKLDRGAFDSAPVSLLTAQSAAAVGAADERRFRPNVLVDTGAGSGFAEDEWVGATVAVGEAVLRIDREDRRCGVVSVDPDTAHRDPAVLRAIATRNDMTLGVYATVVLPGRITVGDPVALLDLARPRAGTPVRT
ncbi:MOSC N-terminal beta barrel domain-containing protein [Actinosynnema sp. NPDC050436]|uniref:MOSC domain-containing protein n=1 Tax=Actinosynnema sp. NPDC050436 TaxID=3155659 RepID=UPI0033F5C372